MASNISVVKVFLNLGSKRQFIGRLAMKNRAIYFEYDSAFLSSGIEISPFKLPLRPGVQQSTDAVFEGLFGVFNDSLPDGWGRLLIDRYLAQNSQIPASPLDRLTYIGAHGMGALSYEPDLAPTINTTEPINLAAIFQESQHILAGAASELLPQLLALNSASSGARPKIMVGVNKDKSHIVYGAESLEKNMTHWLIKFRSLHDANDAGNIEFAYSLMAKAAGVAMPPTHLFMAKGQRGFFGVQRFDRQQSNLKIHMHTASGLLHADHRFPSLDYYSLIRASWLLTKNIEDALKLYRMAVFNVLSHNRDDHAKNFAFCMDEQGLWKVAPAYDLTFSSGPGGEHCMMVSGEGLNPSKKHFKELAEKLSLTPKQINPIFDEVLDAINQWPRWAKDSNVSKPSTFLIAKHLKRVKDNW